MGHGDIVLKIRVPITNKGRRSSLLPARILTVIVAFDGAGQAEELDDTTKSLLHLLDKDTGQELEGNNNF